MKKDKGQSLVEVLAALSVIILVVLALVSAVATSMRSSEYARRSSQASSYSQEAMEKVRLYRDASWTNFSNYCPTLGSAVNLTRLGLEPTPPPGFTLSLTCADEGGTDKKKVVVVVSWTDAVGTHQSKLVSYFSKW